MDIREEYKKKLRTAEEAVRVVRSGDWIDYGWNACISASRQLMNGHKWEKFVLDLSFLGWIIVGALCLGVGTLWVTPYMEAANAQFYEYVRTCPSVTED